MTVHVTLSDPDAAVITAVPADRAVTTPPETAATEESDEVHTTSWLDAGLTARVADSPTVMDNAFWLSSIEATDDAFTVTELSPLLRPENELVLAPKAEPEPAQKLKVVQEEEAKQEELDARVYDISAGGGAVKLSINGKKEVLSIEIDPEIVDPDDVEMLQDLVIAAVNEAMRTASETTEREMGKLTGGLNMPGLF